MKKIKGLFIILSLIVTCNSTQGMKRKLEISPVLLQVVEEAVMRENGWRMLATAMIVKKTKFESALTQGKKYQCTQCPYSTGNEHWIKKHKNMHEIIDKTPNVKVYSCNDCGYLNGQKSIMISHEKNHEIKKKYACTIGNCKIKTSNKSSLNRHIKNQHSGLTLGGKSTFKT